jgi:hypothetical protein
MVFLHMPKELNVLSDRVFTLVPMQEDYCNGGGVGAWEGRYPTVHKCDLAWGLLKEPYFLDPRLDPHLDIYNIIEIHSSVL